MQDPQPAPHPSGAPDQLDELDELDRLFLSRLERVAPPDDLTARVLASTVGRTATPRTVLAWPWLLAGLAALSVLTLAGYQLGASLAAADALDLVGAIGTDLGLFLTAPGDVLAALSEVIPWGLVGLAGGSAGLLILASGHVVSDAHPTLRSRSVA